MIDSFDKKPASVDIRTLPFDHFPEYVEGINVYTFKSKEPVFFLPEGRFELILQLKHTIHYKSCLTSDWLVRPASFIGGLHTSSYYVKPAERDVSIIGIKFFPAGAKHFIQSDLNAFKDNLSSLKQHFTKESLGYIEEINSTTPQDKLLLLIFQFLQTNYRPVLRSPIDKALKLMEASKGFSNISELARACNFSDSQFRKRFNQEVGLSPKTYTKILRVKNAHSILRRRNTLNFTQIAYELGYCDQAHFIKDFKSLAHITPGKYYNQISTA